MKSYRITYNGIHNWLLSHKKGQSVGRVIDSCGCVVSNYYADMLDIPNVYDTGPIVSTVMKRSRVLGVKHPLHNKHFKHPKFIQRFIQRIDERYQMQGYVTREEALAELAAAYELRNVERG